jgi:hypothetical protein
VSVTALPKVTVCQPLADSLLKVALASFDPLLVQSVPVWVPAFWLLL